MKKLFLPLLLVGVVAAGGWFYMTPYFAMKRLQNAARSGDTEALRDMVDFPAVRQSIKDEAREAVAGEIGGRSRSGALGSLGGLLAGAVVDRVVDVAVQPEGIAAMTSGIRPGDRRHGDGSREHVDAKVDIHRGYESMDRYVVSFRDEDSGKQRLALVMHRDGLVDWKLSAVRLGED
jgi:hypothetical protein